jgi:hypothetical protein
MSSTDDASPQPPPLPPTIHEATLASGPTGAVIRGAEIDEAAAIARRAAGSDVVVCGDDIDANRALARRIENAAGPATKPQKPHKKAVGQRALPHFQQQAPPPYGHTFYATAKIKRGKGREILYSNAD